MYNELFYKTTSIFSLIFASKFDCALIEKVCLNKGRTEKGIVGCFSCHQVLFNLNLWQQSKNFIDFNRINQCNYRSERAREREKEFDSFN